MNKKLVITLLTIVLIVVVGWAVIHSSNGTNDTSVQDSGNSAPKTTEEGTGAATITTITNSTTTSQTTGTPAVKSFTIHGQDYSFSPNQISVNKGDTVKITFIDDDGYHNLIIEGLNVKTQTIPSGKTDSVTFVASKTGSFNFYCSVGNHRAEGMTGVLVVKG